MTLYVVTIPGTLLTGLTPEALSELGRALRGSDPRETDLGAAEDLDLLTFYPDSSAFSLRLEVEAADTATAEAEARNLATTALRSVGLSAEAAPLGDPVITGIAGA
ncbi:MULTISPECIES: hypothetical protein [unclassified Streptomyces]|uniref:hypothetical protein n=1 Tax=unclassified Streptomyces TaxID=2593676 RepID=UPI001BE769F9|nr:MULTISPECIES: hypothetical protein [unclassified Streptomyces]MBT2407596.1 hypothetical protein [Streptomyces sp. ISL-21]MBT2459095.1 hypothetical protein [Streptomyces sp. ISL-86]MBT2611590.1 hypothetical protein [Streptomyces sp. ISL-87]